MAKKNQDYLNIGQIESPISLLYFSNVSAVACKMQHLGGIN